MDMDTKAERRVSPATCNVEGYMSFLLQSILLNCLETPTAFPSPNLMLLSPLAYPDGCAPPP